MPSLPPIRMSGAVSAHDADELRERLHAFNTAVTGFADGLALSCFLRDDGGALMAGLDGFTWGGYARIEYLWVDDRRRRRGLGRALVTAAVDEARRRGCGTVVVDTHTFQAPAFYEALGFVEVGRTKGTPRGHDQVLLQLRIA